MEPPLGNCVNKHRFSASCVDQFFTGAKFCYNEQLLLQEKSHALSKDLVAHKV